MRMIYLYGDLAQKYGDKFEMDVVSFPEAVRCLSANFSDFATHIMSNEYALFQGDPDNAINITEKMVPFETKTGDFHIVPKIKGGGVANKIFNTGAVSFVIGAALLIGGIAMNATSFGGIVSPYMISAGVSMMIGGAVMMLVSGLIPDIDTESENSRNSFLFSSPENSVAQGGAVPICYGRFLLGSTVISGSFSVLDISDSHSITHNYA